ncbi:hypothetical protein [Spiroplasma tabanidicola]|uniref:Lipoprotein n=1 Tax=Spiroplasma tabanidicola TaxID=324079 RepID=A0A6I6C7T5_9MOLU|nr:hypothetical protein [Spiroplasma tabanidicola]QGS52280.1 hypothetical protein STABA_v1c09270 [Spiroplasma tabanidicola]
MRKILSIVSSISLISISSISIIGCDWKTPPLSAKQLEHIFKTTQDDVYNSYDNDIPLIDKSINYKMPWEYQKDDQNIEAAKKWSDNIIGLLSNALVEKDKGYLNKGLNIVNGAENDNYLEDSLEITKEKLNLLKNDYFTVRLNDIKSVSKNQWLSETYSESVKTAIKINNENKEINDKNKPNDPAFKEEKLYSTLDISKLWKIGEENFVSNKYQIRFLFSFSPNVKHDIDPIVFYIDMEVSV